MPTVVVKNDKAVDSLRTEYTRLYSPTTTWGDIVSMNLGYPGLRGYWTMSSVDENIDVYDISGHGRTLSCVYAESPSVSPSAPPAPPPLIRNTMWSLVGYMEGDYDSIIPRDCTGISGTSTLVLTNQCTNLIGYMTSSGGNRSQDYLYLSRRIGIGASPDSASAAIREYNLTSGFSTDITYATQPYPACVPSYLHISIIEDRKIFVYDEADWEEYINDWTMHFHILDFADLSDTVTLTFDPNNVDNNFLDILDIRAITKDNGDIMLYVICTYNSSDSWPDTECGIYMYYKNYTQNGSWGTMQFYVPTSIIHDGANAYADSVSYQDDPCTVVGNDYIVIPTYVEYWVDDPIWDYMQIPVYFVYDIASNTGDYLMDYNVFNEYTNSCWLETIVPDPVNGKVYMLWVDYESDSNYCVVEFNPATLAVSMTWIASGYPDIMMPYSRTQTYIYECDVGRLYNASDGTLACTPGVIDVYVSDMCQTIDDNGGGDPVFWMFSSDSHLHGYSCVDGTKLYDINPSIIRGTGENAVFHLFDRFLIVTNDEDVPGLPNPYSYWHYLVT